MESVGHFMAITQSPRLASKTKSANWLWSIWTTPSSRISSSQSSYSSSSCCWRHPVRGQPPPVLDSPALWGYRHTSTNASTLSWWTPTTTSIAGCMWIRVWRRYWLALMASMSSASHWCPWPSRSGLAAIASGPTTTTRRRWTPRIGRRRSTDTGLLRRLCHRHRVAVDTSWWIASCWLLMAWCSGESWSWPSSGVAATCKQDQRRAWPPLGRSTLVSAGWDTLRWSPVLAPTCSRTFWASPSCPPLSMCVRRNASRVGRRTSAPSRASACDRLRGSPWPGAAHEGTSTRHQWPTIANQWERRGQCHPGTGP